MMSYFYYLIKEVIRFLKKIYKKNKWRKLYPFSETIPINDFNFKNVIVGFSTYGELNILDFGGNNRLIIKNYVSIAQNVTFVLNAEHFTNHISTFPFKVKNLKMELSESFGKGNIIVDDDVWIGYGATIMSGVKIGQGAIIAAGSVITKDVPPYAIVGGIPAKIIRYRFENNLIDELRNVDFSMLTKEMINDHIDDLYKPLKDSSQLDWLPKKKLKL